MDIKFMEFMKEIFLNTLSVEFYYFDDYSQDLTSVDQKFGMLFSNPQKHYRKIKESISSLQYNTVYLIRDNFALHTIVFFPYENKSEFISIGPYLTDKVDEIFINNIADSCHLTLSQIQSLKGFYYSLPYFQSITKLISLTFSLIRHLNPHVEFKLCEKFYSSSSQKTFLQLPLEDYSAYADIVCSRYQAEQHLIQAIEKADHASALQYLQIFFRTPIEPRLQNALSERKSILTTVNVLFRKAAEKHHIHPVYLHDISSRYLKQINECSHVEELDRLIEKMIRGYCFFIKNYSLKGYSAPVIKIINYISLHLSDPITLKDITEELHLSAPYISNLFKKEVGITIFSYITKKRLHSAIKLLNTSSMSIQEIAYYVGIDDANYFTKLFKNEFSCTPSQYRKNIGYSKKPEIF